LGDGDLLNTRGIALYRAGKVSEALQTLHRSDELNRARIKRSLPWDLAFQAMAWRRLGKTDEALEYLARLHSVLAETRRVNYEETLVWMNNDEVQRFLSEAEALYKEPKRAKH
jgi:hypothetical protein